MRSRVGSAWLAATWLLASCGNDPRAPAMVQQDSAGVPIAVVAPVSDWPAQAVLAESPLLVMGEATSPDAPRLNNGYWIPVARLADGAFVVGDGVRFFQFAPDGSLLDVVGRAGDGPGEFRDLRSICAGRGDTLLLVDDGRRVVTVYDLRGRAVVRQFPTVQAVHPGACSKSLLVLVRGLPVLNAPEDRPAAMYELRNILGDTVTEYPNLPRANYGEFETEPSFAFRFDSLFVTDGQRMEVRVYSPCGSLSRIVRVRERGQRADAGEEWGVRVTGSPAAGRSPPPRATSRSRRSNYSRFQLGSDGRYWMLTGADGVTEREWVAISPEGQPIGRLKLPKRSGELRVLEFFGDTALVAEEGSDGQRTLAKYVIEWTGIPSEKPNAQGI